MAKIVPAVRVGVPVPAVVPADSTLLRVYFGPVGFVPSYDQAEIIDQDLAAVPVEEKGGASYYVFDTSNLPAVEGDFDLYFTLADDVGNENDFSPVITVPLDQTPPPALGQPVVL